MRTPATMIPMALMIGGGVLLAGCGPARESGFAEVQRSLAARASLQVHWDRGTPEDEQVREQVHGLLGKELDADAAVRIALLGNRRLQAAFEEIGIAQADLVRAGALRNPVLDAEARFFRGGAVTVEFSVVQNLLDALSLPRRRRLAATAITETELRVTDAVLGLAHAVRTGFHRLQMATQILEVRQTVVQATAASHELARRLRAAGNITELDLAQERDLHEQAKLAQADAEMEVADQRERMNGLLGLWGPDSASWTAAMRLPDLPDREMDLDDLERRAVTASLGLAIARQEIIAGAQRLGISRPAAVADRAAIGLGGEREGDGDWGFGPAISAPLPLFQQGRGAAAAAQAELRRSQRRYEAEAIEVRASARMARTHLVAARARVLYVRAVLLPLRQRIREETRKQYNGMLASPFQFIAAKRMEVEAGADSVRSLGEYWIARARVVQLLSGGPIPDGPDGNGTAIPGAGTGDH